MVFAETMEIVLSGNDLPIKFSAHLTNEAVIGTYNDFRVLRRNVFLRLGL